MKDRSHASADDANFSPVFSSETPPRGADLNACAVVGVSDRLGHNGRVHGARRPGRRTALAWATLLAGCAARAGVPAAAPPRPATLPVAPVDLPPPPDPPWMVDLETELVALRGLPFKWRVPFESESRVAFRNKVRRDLSRELPSSKSADVSRAYTALGFAPQDFDLSRAMEEALATQVSAYYDPEERTFKVIGDHLALDDPKHARVISHELVHALQDQQFDLRAFTDDPRLDDDQRLARRFVVEGEATFLMMAHGLGDGAPAERRLGPWAVAELRLGTRLLAAMDMLDMVSSARQGSSADRLDDEARRELEALAKLPVVVTLPLFEPYFKGAEMISEVWAAGGWPAVDALFRHPPDSTEQALHPAEKLLGHRDPPVRLRLADRDGPVPAARPLQSEVIGELGWRVYFKTWGLSEPEAPAAGWGGDRYWSWAVGDRTLTLTATAWDSEADAARFFAAYEKTLASRFPRSAPQPLEGDGLRLETPAGLVVALVRHGSDVDVVSGARPAELERARKTLASVQRIRTQEPRP
jgi:hypothetical protein